jgi:hypothetical protein
VSFSSGQGRSRTPRPMIKHAGTCLDARFIRFWRSEDAVLGHPRLLAAAAQHRSARGRVVASHRPSRPRRCFRSSPACVHAGRVDASRPRPPALQPAAPMRPVLARLRSSRPMLPVLARLRSSRPRRCFRSSPACAPAGRSDASRPRPPALQPADASRPRPLATSHVRPRAGPRICNRLGETASDTLTWKVPME